MTAVQNALGGDVIVKNTAGAGGTIGVAEAARTKVDGHTLSMAPVGPLTTQPHLRKLPYDVVFILNRYFRAMGTKLPDPPFLDEVPIRFGMAEMTHYHVPLLISPYGYSTYRGS